MGEREGEEEGKAKKRKQVQERDGGRDEEKKGEREGEREGRQVKIMNATHIDSKLQAISNPSNNSAHYHNSSVQQ